MLSASSVEIDASLVDSDGLKDPALKKRYAILPHIFFQILSN